MEENEVGKIAESFVLDRALHRCSLVSIRKFIRDEINDPTTIGDEWVVQFQIECDENESSNYVVVIVDDATGQPKLLESL